MSLVEYHASQSDGAPIELYTFAYGFRVWRYTSADEDYVDTSGNVFKAIYIKRPEIIASTNDTSRDAVFYLSRQAECAGLFFGQAPTGVVSILCQELQRYDPDAELGVVFKGVVAGSKPLDENIELTCMTEANLMSGAGLRKLFQIGCGNFLFDRDCGLNREDHVDVGTVINISGTSITVSGINSLKPDWYAGGYVEYTHSEFGTPERVDIMQSQTDGTLLLFRQPPGLKNAASIKVYWGCDHSLQVCHDKFGNSDNYDGEPDMPDINPWAGDPVF